MKKTLSMLLALSMACALSGCAGGSSTCLETETSAFRGRKSDAPGENIFQGADIILCKLMRGCRGGGEDREAGRPAGGGTADHEDILKQKTDIQKTSVPSHPRFRGFQLIHVLKNFVYKLSHSVYSFCQAGYFSGRSVLMINTLCSRLVNLCNSAD